MPDDPGVSTWTTTRLQLINALRDRKVLASAPVLEGDEALAALADAILACLPEAGQVASSGAVADTVWIIQNPSGSPHAVFATEAAAQEWYDDNPVALAGRQYQAWHLHGADATVPVESAFLRQVLTDAIRACEQDVMADGEAMQGLLSEYRAELAGLPEVTT